MSTETYRSIEGQSAGFVLTNIVLLVLVALGFFAAHYIDTHGHHVTGMSNQIVWGVPHVFAIFLIVSASGALNVASLASVFGQDVYKPLARLSGLLALSLLIGGLVILVLDLGRPERLIVAMTHYNFTSIFAWNIFLYSGFIVIVVVYLWMLMEPRMYRYAGRIGVVAFIWRIVLTTGTGCIFGFLVARESYDAAILAPLFVAISLSFGLAVFILATVLAFRGAEYPDPSVILERLRRLLGIFSVVVLYLVMVRHLTNLYAPAHQDLVRFLLLEGAPYPLLFWVGQIGIGTVAPIVIAFHRGFAASTRSLLLAAGLVVVGAFCQLYVLIIGGQAYPLTLSSQFEVIESSFFDGVVASYHPSGPEIMLGIGAVAVSILLFTLGLKIFRCLPDSDGSPTG